MDSDRQRRYVEVIGIVALIRLNWVEVRQYRKAPGRVRNTFGLRIK